MIGVPPPRTLTLTSRPCGCGGGSRQNRPSAAKGDDDAPHEQPAVLLSGAAVPLFGPFRQLLDLVR